LNEEKGIVKEGEGGAGDRGRASEREEAFVGKIKFTMIRHRINGRERVYIRLNE